MSVNLPGESLPNSPAAPGFVVSGMAVCDEATCSRALGAPEDKMLALITAKLVDYDVEINRGV